MTVASREDFLNALFDGAEGHLELRAIPPRGGPVPCCFSQPGSAAWRESFVARHAGDNLFFGIASRKDASSGALANCLTVGAVWADLDFKVTPELEAQQRVRAFPVPPSITIRSGNGVHCYWLLRKRVAVTDPQLRQVLEGLAAALHGDPAVAEPAHIMRLPGSRNMKYDPPREVVITRFHPERRVALVDLLKHLPAVPPQAPREFRSTESVTLAPLAPVLETCDFMRWCRDHPADVSEPLWYAMVSNLSRCEGGREAAHQFSARHPGYTKAETDAKFDHALEGSAPITCARIQALGFSGCPAEGHGVASPAALGLRAPDVAAKAATVVARLEARPPIGGGADGHATTTDEAPPRPEAGASDPLADPPDRDADAPGSAPFTARWKTYDAADVHTWGFPAPAFLVDELLPTRGLVWIAGLPHSGKSLLMLYLALSLACDRPLAAGHFAVRAHPRVLYVSREDPGGRTEARMRDILAGWGVDPPAPGRLTFIVRDAIDLLDSADVTGLRDLCRSLGATVLIVDTWTALSPTADPAAAKEQTQLAQIVVALADNIDGLVAVLDHLRKNPPDGALLSLADIYGPIQKAQRAEHGVVLKAHEGPERRLEVLVDGKDLDEVRRFFLTRSADGAPGDKFSFAGTVQAGAEQARAAGQRNRDAVFSAVPIAPNSATPAAITERLMAAKMPLAESTVRGHLRALLHARRVQRTGKGPATAYWREETRKESAEGSSPSPSSDSA